MVGRSLAILRGKPMSVELAPAHLTKQGPSSTPVSLELHRRGLTARGLLDDRDSAGDSGGPSRPERGVDELCCPLPRRSTEVST